MDIFISGFHGSSCFRAGIASMGIGWCTAEYDYAANQPNQLSLSRGDRIAIINKAGDARGWWKGRKDGRVSDN